MRTHAGIASKMFRALADERINIQMISTSEIKTSVVVDEKYMELAVRVLHKAFELEKRRPEVDGSVRAAREPAAARPRRTHAAHAPAPSPALSSLFHVGNGPGAVMSYKVYVDGQEGTTGLRIHECLAGRDDIDVLRIDADKRKDAAERANLLNAADVAFLCLPDAASPEAAALVTNPSTCLIDASTAFRTDPVLGGVRSP